MKILSCMFDQGMFLPLVVPPTNFQAALWSTWLAVLCSLKVLHVKYACWL